MNKLKGFTAAAAVTAMLVAAAPLNAFALTVNNEQTKFEPENSVFHVEGEADYAGSPVKLEILKNGESFENLTDAGKILYVNQRNSGNDKNFEFTVPVADKGTFYYRISGFGTDSVYTDVFSTYDEEMVNTAIEKYIQDPARTENDLEQLINSFYPNLKVDLPLFSSLSPAAKAKLLTTVNSAQYWDSDSFIKDLSNKTAEEIVFEAESADNKRKYTEKFSKELDIESLGIYKEYIGMDASKRTQIVKALKQNEPYQSFRENFGNAFIIYSVKNALWNNVTALISEYTGENVENIFAGVSSSRRKSAIDSLQSALKSGKVTKAEDMSAYLRSSIPAEQNSSSGGGGGGASNSSSPIILPASTAGSASAAKPEPNINIVSTNDDNSGVDTDNTIASDLQQRSSGYFIDIDSSAWAQDAINYLYRKGVINGKADNIYAPQDSVTREEFVKMALLAFGIEPTGNGNSFDDVAYGSWYAPYVYTAYRKGIFGGESDTVFGTGHYIKRQDMAKIVCNILKNSGMDQKTAAELEFNDTDEIEDYAVEPVSLLVALGCINGDDEGNFMPNKHLTRAEAAQVIYKAVNVL